MADDEPGADVEQGARLEERDHALVRLDEKEVKSRMLQAFDRFVALGFEASLIAQQQRDAILYKLALGFDGGEDLPLRRVQAIADEFRLDVFLERGTGLAMYARW